MEHEFYADAILNVCQSLQSMMRIEATEVVYVQEGVTTDPNPSPAVCIYPELSFLEYAIEH